MTGMGGSVGESRQGLKKGGVHDDRHNYFQYHFELLYFFLLQIFKQMFGNCKILYPTLLNYKIK